MKKILMTGVIFFGLFLVPSPTEGEIKTKITSQETEEHSFSGVKYKL